MSEQVLAGEYMRSSALAAGKGKGKKASQRKIREAFSGTYGDGHGACMGFGVDCMYVWSRMYVW